MSMYFNTVLEVEGEVQRAQQVCGNHPWQTQLAKHHLREQAPTAGVGCPDMAGF